MQDRRWEPWPWILVGLLAAMITGSISFWAIAATHRDPLVVDDVWLADGRYREAHAAAANAAADGIALEVRSEAIDGGRWVEVSVESTSTTAPVVREIRIRRERPAEGGFDADFALEPQGNRWVGRLPLPRPGRWRLVAAADVGDDTIRKAVDVWHATEEHP